MIQVLTTSPNLDRSAAFLGEIARETTGSAAYVIFSNPSKGSPSL